MGNSSRHPESSSEAAAVPKLCFLVVLLSQSQSPAHTANNQSRASSPEGCLIVGSTLIGHLERNKWSSVGQWSSVKGSPQYFYSHPSDDPWNTLETKKCPGNDQGRGKHLPQVPQRPDRDICPAWQWAQSEQKQQQLCFWRVFGWKARASDWTVQSSPNWTAAKSKTG